MIEYTKDKPLRVFEGFAGYGSQILALERLKRDFPEFDYKSVGWSEFDPDSKSPIDRQPAVIAHNALHPDAGENYGDICNIDWEKVPDFDLFTYSFPCQSISQAGLQHGLEEGSGTKSSLLWECEKAIRIKKPRYLLMENVKALVSNKFIKDFYKWLELLDRYGYASFSQVLNSSQYGVPQNRERIFCLSILRTDEEPDPKYFFPKPFKLEKRLRDCLEDEVEEKYYISDELLRKFQSGEDLEENELSEDGADYDDDDDDGFGGLFEDGDEEDDCD